MTQNELQSKTIDLLRFPLAAGVVIIHTAGAVNVDPEVEIYHRLVDIFAKVICTVAVPLFFVISGYLYFAHVKQWNNDIYITKSKSRLRTLVIPFLIWNAIGFLVGIAKGVAIYYTKGETIEVIQQLSSISGWIKPFWSQWHYGPVQDAIGNNFYISYPYVGALWFLRDLIGVCILAPIIYYLVKYARIWGLLLLAVAYCSNIWLHIPGFGIEVCFFFSIGAYCGVHKKNMVTFCRKACIPMILICLISFGTTISDLPNLYQSIIPRRVVSLTFIVSMGMTLINLASLLLEKKKASENRKLTQTTFFIYVSHGLAISTLSPVFSSIFASNSAISKASLFFLFPITVILFCILAYYVLSRIAPKLLSRLIGQR